jgi:hypothetical protein
MTETATTETATPLECLRAILLMPEMVALFLPIWKIGCVSNPVDEGMYGFAFVALPVLALYAVWYTFQIKLTKGSESELRSVVCMLLLFGCLLPFTIFAAYKWHNYAMLGGILAADCSIVIIQFMYLNYRNEQEKKNE